MDGFQSWFKISQFRNVVKWANINQVYKVSYRPKVKLHGTNAGVRILGGKVQAQSRNQDITVENDNVGFAAWVKEREQDFLDTGLDDCIIYGEWCGPGVQKGTSIQLIKERVFCVFAVYDIIYPVYVVSPDTIRDIIDDIDGLYVIPWFGESFSVDFSRPDSRVAFAELVNGQVNDVESCDPFVLDTFGVSGIGEGLVYYPIDTDIGSENEAFKELTFKAKGEAHRVAQRKKAAVSTISSVTLNGFVDMFVTSTRVIHGVNEACQGQYDRRLTGDLLKWIGNDIRTEGADELVESGLVWKDVAKLVANRARSIYFKAIDSWASPTVV